MDVILAGYNLDVEIINELRAFVDHVRTGISAITQERAVSEDVLRQLMQEAERLMLLDNLTPETLSAAYARISRDPRPVSVLRQISRQEVPRARKSNRAIIFDMGHASVAEHAYFNIDVIGVSRLAVEIIERQRLASFTEKSQRYIRLDDSFFIPEEMQRAGLQARYIALVREQQARYRDFLNRLSAVEGMHERRDKQADSEGAAQEDSRYILPLATEAQFGMSINARSLERLLRRSASHSLHEIRSFSQQLYTVVYNRAPSLVKYTQPTDYYQKTRSELAQLCMAGEPEWNRGLAEPKEKKAIPVLSAPVLQLADYTPFSDERILAAVMFTTLDMSYEACWQKARMYTQEQKTQLFKAALRYVKSYDSVLREYEQADFTFECIMSASCFAQLKRHRIATIHSQDYDPARGVMIPPSLITENLKEDFLKTIENVNTFFFDIKPLIGQAASYILTNAHLRRVLFKLNARELYHFVRLRADHHAQWEIRAIARQMIAVTAEKAPLTALLLCGKDQFDEIYQKIF